MSRGPWLVTGASGFLGRHLLETVAAIGDSHAPLALVRDAAAWHSMPWTQGLPGVQTLTGTVTETGTWAEDPLLDGVEGIFHLAALVKHSRRDAELVHHTNVQGTLGMVRLAAARQCRLVFVSTSGTVGCFRRPGQSADEEAPYCDQAVAAWPYYHSKIEAERQARRLASELGVDLVILRPPVLLGPGDHRLRSSGHVLRLLSGKLPFLVDGGMHYADVRDVARALLAVMQTPRPRPIYHLPGTVQSIVAFYREVAELSGRRPPRLLLPFRAAWLLSVLAERAGLTRFPEPRLVAMASHHWSVHSRYAEAELGYRSRPGRETLADTIAWLKTNHPELV